MRELRVMHIAAAPCEQPEHPYDFALTADQGYVQVAAAAGSKSTLEGVYDALAFGIGRVGWVLPQNGRVADGAVDDPPARLQRCAGGFGAGADADNLHAQGPLPQRPAVRGPESPDLAPALDIANTVTPCGGGRGRIWFGA